MVSRKSENNNEFDDEIIIIDEYAESESYDTTNPRSDTRSDVDSWDDASSTDNPVPGLICNLTLFIGSPEQFFSRLSSVVTLMGTAMTSVNSVIDAIGSKNWNAAITGLVILVAIQGPATVAMVYFFLKPPILGLVGVIKQCFAIRKQKKKQLSKMHGSQIGRIDQLGSAEQSENVVPSPSGPSDNNGHLVTGMIPNAPDNTSTVSIIINEVSEESHGIEENHHGNNAVRETTEEHLISDGHSPSQPDKTIRIFSSFIKLKDKLQSQTTAKRSSTDTLSNTQSPALKSEINEGFDSQEIVLTPHDFASESRSRSIYSQVQTSTMQSHHSNSHNALEDVPKSSKTNEKGAKHNTYKGTSLRNKQHNQHSNDHNNAYTIMKSSPSTSGNNKIVIHPQNNDPPPSLSSSFLPSISVGDENKKQSKRAKSTRDLSKIKTTKTDRQIANSENKSEDKKKRISWHPGVSNPEHMSRNHILNENGPQVNNDNMPSGIEAHSINQSDNRRSVNDTIISNVDQADSKTLSYTHIRKSGESFRDGLQNINSISRGQSLYGSMQLAQDSKIDPRRIKTYDATTTFKGRRQNLVQTCLRRP